MMPAELLDVLPRLDQLATLRLECDGLTRVFSHVLWDRGIEHVVKLGRLIVDRQSVVPHYWIERGHWVIDYRGRMWAGNKPHIPHGVFRRRDFPGARYSGARVHMPVSLTLYEVLTRHGSLTEARVGL